MVAFKYRISNAMRSLRVVTALLVLVKCLMRELSSAAGAFSDDTWSSTTASVSVEAMVMGYFTNDC